MARRRASSAAAVSSCAAPKPEPSFGRREVAAPSTHAKRPKTCVYLIKILNQSSNASATPGRRYWPPLRRDVLRSPGPPQALARTHTHARRRWDEFQIAAGRLRLTRSSLNGDSPCGPRIGGHTLPLPLPADTLSARPGTRLGTRPGARWISALCLSAPRRPTPASCRSISSRTT